MSINAGIQLGSPISKATPYSPVTRSGSTIGVTPGGLPAKMPEMGAITPM